MILEEASDQALKRAAKLKFVQQEMAQLQDHAKDLEHSLRLNKLTLIEMSHILDRKLQPQQQQYCLNQSLRNLSEQNDSLRSTNERLQRQGQSLKCQMLIASQVKGESQQQYHGLMKSYEEKVLELRRTIQDKQYTIQEKQTCQKDPFNLRAAGVFPKHDLVRMQLQHEQYLQLTKKLTSENNFLKSQLGTTQKDLTVKTQLLNRYNDLLSSANGYHCLKELLRMKADKRPKSSNHYLKQPNHEILTPKTVAQGGCKTTQQTPCNITSTLRKLLFKEKRSVQLLTRQLAELLIKQKALSNTNKLLTESNINYQVKRTQIKSQLNYYRHKYSQIAGHITRRNLPLRSSVSLSNANLGTNTISSIGEIISKQKQVKVVRPRLAEIKTIMMQSSKVWTNSIIRHIKHKVGRRSFSCMSDYIYSEPVIKGQPVKPCKIPKPTQQSLVDPFLLDCSIIKPQEDFGDISACFKKTKRKQSTQKRRQHNVIF